MINTCKSKILFICSKKIGKKITLGFSTYSHEGQKKKKIERNVYLNNNFNFFKIRVGKKKK